MSQALPVLDGHRAKTVCQFSMQVRVTRPECLCSLRTFADSVLPFPHPAASPTLRAVLVVDSTASPRRDVSRTPNQPKTFGHHAAQCPAAVFHIRSIPVRKQLWPCLPRCCAERCVRLRCRRQETSSVVDVASALSLSPSPLCATWRCVACLLS